jgi:hypothetical protein
MKSDKLRIQSTELTLVFDRFDLPYQDIEDASRKIAQRITQFVF